MTKKTKRVAALSGSNQEDMFKKLRKITKKDSFLMSITTFNPKSGPGKELDTYLLINDFPYTKLRNTKKMIVKLIDNAKKR